MCLSSYIRMFWKKLKSNLKQKCCFEFLILVVLPKLEIWFLDCSNQDFWQIWCNALHSLNKVPFIGICYIFFIWEICKMVLQRPVFKFVLPPFILNTTVVIYIQRLKKSLETVLWLFVFRNRGGSIRNQKKWRWELGRR